MRGERKRKMIDKIHLFPYETSESDKLPDRALTWLQTKDGKVAIACGNGHMAFLDPEHQIADDGSVTPSLGCPEEGCDWHVFGKLVGWEAETFTIDLG